MKKLTQISAAAALAIGVALSAQPASAQVAGIASADPTLAIGQTKAFVAASSQINTAYKAQFEQINARQASLQAQLKPLIPLIDTNKDGNVTQAEFNAAVAAKKPAATTWMNYQKAANEEINKLTAPIVKAQAYAIENISNAYPAALKQVVADKKINVVLTPDSFVYAPDAVDVTADIAAAIDKTTPTVSITPPANWEPTRQTQQIQEQLQRYIAMRNAQARAAAASGAATAPAAKKPADTGR